MKIKRVVKRLFAVGAGVGMLGATAMGALAADLNQYPEMFVDDGAFNGYFVVGKASASEDNLAMTDIAANMMAPGESSSTSVSVSGDAWLAETDSNFLELGEQINSVEDYADDTMLGALADGVISNSKGNADYEQFLYFDENRGFAAFQEDDDDQVGYFFNVSSSNVIARYVLDFTSNLESDIDSNGVYDDIEDETITLLGRQYTIVTATNETAGPKWVLMGGSVADTMNEGETMTYNVGDTDYEVELVFVDADEAQFLVNGESTGKLNDGETEVLDDGVTTIGVSDILYQDYAGGVHQASFFIGADKIELQDGSDMKVNEETISDAAVLFTESFSGGDVSISELSINMTAEDDLFIPVGGKLSEVADLDEPEVMFTQNWDLELAGIEKGDVEMTSVVFTESDEQADVKTVLYSGEVTIPAVFTNTSGMDAGEKEDEPLVWVGVNQITKNDYFVLSTADPKDDQSDAKSYLLRYKGSDSTTDDSPKVYFDDVGSGDALETSLDSDGTFDLRLGGVTFNFANQSIGTNDDFPIQRSSGGNTGIVTSGERRTLYLRTADNHLVSLTDNNATHGANGLASTWEIAVEVDDVDKFDDTGDAGLTVLNVTLNDDADRDFTSTAATMAATSVTDPDDSDITYYASSFGELLTVTSPDSGPDKYELEAPNMQAQVKLYLTSGATTTASSRATGDLAPVRVGTATLLDNEVSAVDANNLIVVGGPCVNTVAAELLNSGDDCTAGFEQGQARVKLFEHANGNVAMLVAGYSGKDTRLAGRVIAHRWDELSGSEVVIEGTTYQDATIGAPSQVAPAVAEEEEEEAAAGAEE